MHPWSVHFSFPAVLEMNLGFLSMLGKNSSAKLYPQPDLHIFKTSLKKIPRVLDRKWIRQRLQRKKRRSWNGLNSRPMWFSFTTLITKGSKGQNYIRLAVQAGCAAQPASPVPSPEPLELFALRVFQGICEVRTWLPKPVISLPRERSRSAEPAPGTFKGNNLLSLLPASSGFRSPFSGGAETLGDVAMELGGASAGPGSPRPGFHPQHCKIFFFSKKKNLVVSSFGLLRKVWIKIAWP